MWTVTRLVHFEPQHSGMLLNAVRPIVESVRLQWNPRRIVVRPHWKRGPHIDVVVDCNESESDGVRRHCEREAAEWLRQNPSRTNLDAAIYARQSEILGRAEQEAGPYLPLYENNTVIDGEYRRPAVMQSESLTEARDDFLSEQLGTTFDLAETLARDRVAGFLRLMQMMASLGQCTDSWFANLAEGNAAASGLALGHLSYRAHAEAYLTNLPAQRERFDRMEVRLRPAVDRIVRASRDQADARVGEAAHSSSSWMESLERLKARIRRIVGEEYEQLHGVSESPVRERPAGPVVVSASPGASPSGGDFFSALHSEQARRIFATPEHMTYRVLLNFFYLLLPIAGVSAPERAALCYVVASACERVFDVDWRRHFFGAA